ncbi:acyl carrier protein [Syntrophomonas palmitatica]|mgnify:FL=1|uniref:acyl carrier protein n=1 Tax=Syntrophomonas palmitatica TaxID=402877 RepID=UPI0006D24614|nr:acyl carrier protein [Syntrophomonas palmitatica]
MPVFEVMKQIIMEIKDLPEDAVTMDASFADDLEADSLDVVEMLMLLEEKYDITIPEEAAEEMKTVRDAVEYIENLLADK